MSESSWAMRNGLEVLRVGVLVGLLDVPDWHAGTRYLSGGRTLLTLSNGGAWPLKIHKSSLNIDIETAFL